MQPAFFGFTVIALTCLSSAVSNLPNAGRALQMRTNRAETRSIVRMVAAVQMQRWAMMTSRSVTQARGR